jgi:hypothetical protein
VNCKVVPHENRTLAQFIAKWDALQQVAADGGRGFGRAYTGRGLTLVYTGDAAVAASRWLGVTMHDVLPSRPPLCSLHQCSLARPAPLGRAGIDR